jgi:hypothetical protein
MKYSKNVLFYSTFIKFFIYIFQSNILKNNLTSTMADNKPRPARHWPDTKMRSRHHVQLTPFLIFGILVKIKIEKRSAHQREVLLQISYASAS